MITEKDKLSDVISRNIDLLPIVHRLGLSAGIGEKTIGEACASAGTDTRFALGLLNTFSASGYFPGPEELDLPSLVTFLIQTHEHHKQVTIPRLAGLVDQMKGLMPGEKLLIVVEKYLHQYIEKLIRHIDYEEKEIFPLVQKNGTVQSGSSASSLKRLYKEHANVENEISDLKTIIIRHIPEHADMSLVHDLLHTLSHFEKEQVDHARFEDKILIPMIISIYSR